MNIEDYSTLFDLLPIGAYRTTSEGRHLRANKALVRLNGYDTEAEMVTAVNDLATEWYVDPGRRDESRAVMHAQGRVIDFVSEVWRHKTRERIWIREHAHALYDANGVLCYFEGTVEDITEWQLDQQRLRQSEARFRALTELSAEWFWEQDADYRFTSMTGLDGPSPGTTPGLHIGKTCWELPDVNMDEATWQDHREQLARRETFRNFELIRKERDGSRSHYLTSGVPRFDAGGQFIGYQGVGTDITDRRHAEAAVHRLAHFDVLTKLPNRALFADRLGQEIRRAERSGEKVALFLLDLDRFKEINDELGHDQGDRLLIETARRVRSSVRELDTVARLGGDEFLVIVSELASARPLDTIAQNILNALSQPFGLQGGTGYVSASIGIAVYPDDAGDIDGLLKAADQAMYAAKENGRNCFSYFTPELQAATHARLWLASALRVALAQKQFWLAYQPIIDLSTGCVRKAEALLRWQHPERGLISPATFIPVAESTGLINGIGEWVFRQVAQQVKQWRGTLHADFQISVNKSPLQFHRPDTAGTAPWSDYLQNLGLDGKSIVVEITEGLLLEASPHVIEQLRSLREARMQVALDDFGTGYSSLSYLQKYDIDCLKIDQSFVRHLRADSKELALCEAIIVMAHKLGMQVVAEGVETAEQRDLLRLAGCDFGQGYLFASPMPADAFERFLSQGALAVS
ncbi:MAG: hypothetical protein RIR45_1234 [Pseudomonadota bacterium]